MTRSITNQDAEHNVLQKQKQKSEIALKKSVKYRQKVNSDIAREHCTFNLLESL